MRSGGSRGAEDRGDEADDAASEPAASDWPEAWADALSVGLLRTRDGRVERVNARLAALADAQGGADALRGAPLHALFEDAGGGLPGPRSTGPVACRLRRAAAAPLPVEVAPLRARAGGALLEVRPADAPPAREAEELLTLVSHELRTPLTVIAGFNRLLLSERAGPLTAEQRHFLEECARSCRRLAAFVGNVIDAAREAAGHETVELREASLASTLEEVARFLKPLVDERSLRLDLDLAAGARRARFDPLHLEQVLTNLLANAVRHSPSEGAIRVRARPLEAGGARLVEVAVDDEGPGIPEADRERIFRAYVRGAGGTGGGLGLGLALCRRVVERHGGTIRAGTSPEGGARVVFTLPAAEAEGT